MKIIKSIRYIYLTLAVMSLSSLFFTCKNPLATAIPIAIKADATGAPSTIRVYDVSTNTRLDVSGNVPVIISGKDAHHIYTPGGYNTFTVFEGQVLVSLRKGINPTPQNPVEFNVTIKPDGYLSVTYPIKLTTSLPTNFEIGMVNLSSLPKGSSVTTVTPPTKIDSSGKTSAPIVIKTDTVTTPTGPSTTVTVPTGTQMQDAKGNPITQPTSGDSAQLKTTIVFFPPNDQTLKSFPGGLESSNIQDTSGKDLNDGTMAPAGWVNIEMKVGNTDVKNFSQPIIVNMDIDAASVNPNTDAPYVAGDSINIYSKSEGDENWILESVEAVIKDPISGRLVVPMKVSHLSVWAAANFSTSCNTPFAMDLKNTDVNDPTTVTVKIFKASNTLTKVYPALKTTTVTIPSLSTVSATFNNWKATAGKQYFIQIIEPTGDSVEFGPQVLCGNNPVPYTAQITGNKMAFKVKIRCTNGNSVLLPVGTTVYYIDNSVYNNTFVGSGLARHKVDPSDQVPNTWKPLVADVKVIDNVSYNIIILAPGTLLSGTNYRFSVYYDTNNSGSGSREDKIFPEMDQAVDPTGLSGPMLTNQLLNGYKNTTTPINITLPRCPF